MCFKMLMNLCANFNGKSQTDVAIELKLGEIRNGEKLELTDSSTPKRKATSTASSILHHLFTAPCPVSVSI